MKRLTLAGLLLVSSATHAFAQVDTYHVFKDGPVSLVQPRVFTNVAYLDVPAWQSYMVIGKTEVQNNGWDSLVTCQLLATNAYGAVFAGDPVTVFIAQGNYALAAMTIVTPPHADPDSPTTRFWIRCGALWTPFSSTNFVVRQTKITAHKATGVQITAQ